MIVKLKRNALSTESRESPSVRSGRYCITRCSAPISSASPSQKGSSAPRAWLEESHLGCAAFPLQPQKAITQQQDPLVMPRNLPVPAQAMGRFLARFNDHRPPPKTAQLMVRQTQHLVLGTAEHASHFNVTPGSLPSRCNPTPHKNNAFQKMPGKGQMSLESQRAVQLFSICSFSDLQRCSPA